MFKLLLVLFAVTGLAAQSVSYTAVAHTDLATRSWAGTRQDNKAVPMGRSVLNSTPLSSSSSDQRCWGSARLAVTGGPGRGVQIAASGSGFAPVSIPMCSGGGGASGTIRAVLRAAQPTRGRLVVTTSLPSSTGFPFNSYAVDVDRVRLMAYSGLGNPRGVHGVLEQAVDLDPNGVEVLLSFSVVGSGALGRTGSSSFSASVQFLPTPGRVWSEGSACGPNLTSRWINDPARSGPVLDLVARGSIPTPHAFFVIGSIRQAVPVPPTQCMLRTNILASFRVPVQSTGTARWTVPVPASLRGSFRMQYLAGTRSGTVDRWRTSEAVLISLP